MFSFSPQQSSNWNIVGKKGLRTFSFPWKLAKPSPWKLGFCRWHFLDGLHPGRLTWNLQITHEKKGKWSEPNLQGIMVHVNLPGCNFPHSPIVPRSPQFPRNRLQQLHPSKVLIQRWSPNFRPIFDGVVVPQLCLAGPKWLGFWRVIGTKD